MEVNQKGSEEAPFSPPPNPTQGFSSTSIFMTGTHNKAAGISAKILHHHQGQDSCKKMYHQDGVRITGATGDGGLGPKVSLCQSPKFSIFFLAFLPTNSTKIED